MTPLDRRGFLRTGTAAAAGVAVTPVLRPTAVEARAARRYRRVLPDGWTYPVAAALLPFGHGVMSGDPLADRVILWTRITIPDERGWDATRVTDPQGFRRVPVRWVVARDPALRRVVRRGRVTTSAALDWTVKVDVDRLPSGTTLYYAFEALGWRSPVARTRTAPAPGQDSGPLTIAHFACTSWWHDQFNSFARAAERPDLDLITHAGDHVYDNSGGHPASRVWADQWSWDTDLDNADVRTPAELRRRYALYYADPQLVLAHHAAPWAIMADQHDYDAAAVDGVTTLTTEQAGEVFFEWTPTRPPRPDGSGTFPPSPGPDRQVPVPRGAASLLSYRVLPYGDLADVVLLDVRRFAGREGERSQVLGDTQWAWLERTLLASARRARFRVVVNQVNLGQLRAFNLPAASAFAAAFGMDPNLAEGEIYTTAWGAHPAERTRLLSWLRAQGIVDNVVLSGDSHGFFGNDLVEDPQLPAYDPVTGGGLLGAVGVEMVGSTAGRPGGQDVIAEELYFAAVGGSRGAAFADAEGYDAQYRPAALAPTLALEAAARVANPHLRFFNWRADYGHVVLQLQPEQAVLECWSTPQRVVSPEQTLLAQHTSALGAPHLAPVLAPAAVAGPSRGALAPAPATTRARRGR